MTYVSGFLAAVPQANRQAYIDHAEKAWPLFQKAGALAQKECWENDVPEGKLTSFPMAVKREEGEAVVFSWILWPDQATAHACWDKMHSDPEWAELFQGNPPFDGKRMVFGGFDMVVDR